MSLTSHLILRIREIAKQMVGDDIRVPLFGSRAIDGRTGGDIDQDFESDPVLPNRAEAICKLYGALVLALGDRKIDVIVKDAATPPAPIFDIARREGVSL